MLTRRNFLGTVAAATLAATRSATADTADPKKIAIITTIKYFFIEIPLLFMIFTIPINSKIFFKSH